MSTPLKASTPNIAGRRPSVAPIKTQNTPTRSPSRLSSSTTSSPAVSNASKTRSVRTGAGAGTTSSTPTSARAAVRKSVSYTKASDGAAEDARAGAASAALEDMRERLQKAELAAEENMKQAHILQARLDDTNAEHTKLEESVHEYQEKMEELENEKKENVRKRREIESIYETDQANAIKEREDAQIREEELRKTIQRMKESQKELRVNEDEKRPDLSRPSSFRNTPSPHLDGTHFAPPSSLERSDSRSSSRLVLQKDKIIESLRLELAESQIKIAELENIGGGRMQELERALLEAKVTNGRLMEDNESFQLLLAEKTINGDFVSFLKPPSEFGSRPPSRDANGSTSLADELESATEIDAAEHRRLVSEMAGLRDQNKALSLYINNIISRLLQHKEFENILDKTPATSMPISEVPAEKLTEANVNKSLPPPPPEAETSAAPSLLQRATSVVRGRPRPQPLSQPSSYSEANPTLTEDPATAPRVPLSRPQSTRVISGGGGSNAHRRSNSDWSHAAVVSNMYRGPATGSGQMSPGFSPQRNSTFVSNPTALTRMSSAASAPRYHSEGESDRLSNESMAPPPLSTANSSNNVTNQRDSKISSSRNSMVSEPETNGSPPRSMTSTSEKPSGAIMAGNKMRPLRLVREATEAEEAVKKANRTSWMGWFNKGGAAGAPGAPTRVVSGELTSPVKECSPVKE